MHYDNEPFEKIMEKLIELIGPVITHAIAMGVTILCIWGIDVLLKVTLGENAKLFGSMPIAWVAHVGDCIAILRFFWKMLKEF